MGQVRLFIFLTCLNSIMCKTKYMFLFLIIFECIQPIFFGNILIRKWHVTPLTTYYIYHAFKKSIDIGFDAFKKGLVSPAAPLHGKLLLV